MNRHTGVRSIAWACLAFALAGAIAAGCAAPVRVNLRAATPAAQSAAQDAEPMAYTFACADGKSFKVVFSPHVLPARN